MLEGGAFSYIIFPCSQQSHISRFRKVIEAGIYLSVSDFVREAIREKLKAIKVIKVRDVDYETAKKEVLGYYRSYREAYPHEVAENLELDYEMVWQITEELKKEGRLRAMRIILKENAMCRIEKKLRFIK